VVGLLAFIGDERGLLPMSQLGHSRGLTISSGLPLPLQQRLATPVGRAKAVDLRRSHKGTPGRIYRRAVGKINNIQYLVQSGRMYAGLDVLGERI
jgi:hypothetical protein